MPEQINPLLRMNISTGKYVPKTGSAAQTPATTGKDKATFGDVLSRIMEKDAEIKYSAHAQKRLQERGITFSQQDKADIDNAVALAGKKGVRESLVMVKDVALIINIPNRTVVTAVDRESMKNNVFTNIDGAVII